MSESAQSPRGALLSRPAMIPVRRCPRCDGDFVPATESTTVCVPCDNPAAARQAAFEARMAEILRQQDGRGHRA